MTPTEAMNELTENIKQNVEKFTINNVIKVLVENDQYTIANLIFLGMGLYLTACCFKGNQTLGFRFASPTFYPMRSNETQFSSMMFNVLILNFCSMPILFSVCDLMPSYLKDLTIYKIYKTISYSDMIYWITYNNLVTKGCFVVAMLTIIFHTCFGGYRLKFKDLDKKYRSQGKIKSQNDMKRKVKEGEAKQK